MKNTISNYLPPKTDPEYAKIIDEMCELSNTELYAVAVKSVADAILLAEYPNM